MLIDGNAKPMEGRRSRSMCATRRLIWSGIGAMTAESGHPIADAIRATAVWKLSARYLSGR